MSESSNANRQYPAGEGAEVSDMDSEEMEETLNELTTTVASLQRDVTMAKRRIGRLEELADDLVPFSPPDVLPDGADSRDANVIRTLYARSPNSVTRSHLRQLYQDWTDIEDTEELDRRIQLLITSSVLDPDHPRPNTWTVTFDS